MAKASARPLRRWFPVVVALAATVLALGALAAHLVGLGPLPDTSGVLRLAVRIGTAPALVPLRLARRLGVALVHPGQATAGTTVLDLLLVGVAAIVLLRPSGLVGWATTTVATVVGTAVLLATPVVGGAWAPWVVAGLALAVYATGRGWTWVAAAGVAVAVVQPAAAIPVALCLLAAGHGRLVPRAVAALTVAAAPFAALVTVGLVFRAVHPTASTLATAGSGVVPVVVLLAGSAVAAWRVGKELGLTVA